MEQKFCNSLKWQNLDKNVGFRANLFENMPESENYTKYITSGLCRYVGPMDRGGMGDGSGRHRPKEVKYKVIITIQTIVNCDTIVPSLDSPES